MSKFFTTELDEQRKTYVFTPVEGSYFTVEVSGSRASGITVEYKGAVEMSGEAFDDLNVRIRAARIWIFECGEDVDALRDRIGTV